MKISAAQIGSTPLKIVMNHVQPVKIRNAARRTIHAMVTQGALVTTQEEEEMAALQIITAGAIIPAMAILTLGVYQ